MDNTTTNTDETWTQQTVYTCFACGSALLVNSTGTIYKCPHCGIIQYGTPLNKILGV